MTSSQTTKKSKGKLATPQQTEARAVLRYLRIAPRKVRLVADLVRGMGVVNAQAQLQFASKRGTDPVLKVLRSALANAKEKKMDETKLYIAEIRVDSGPILKRWIARAQGRGTPIHKKTSHITLVLKESEKMVQSAFVIVKKQSKKEKAVEQAKQEKETKKEAKKEKKVAEPEKKSEKKPTPKKETKEVEIKEQSTETESVKSEQKENKE